MDRLMASKAYGVELHEGLLLLLARDERIDGDVVVVDVGRVALEVLGLQEGNAVPSDEVSAAANTNACLQRPGNERDTMAAHERTCCRKMAPIRGAGSANVASMSARNSYEQECENDSKRVRMVADDGDEDGTHTFWTWMISGRLEKILERSAGLMMGFLVCVLASIGSYHTWHRAVAAEQQRRRERASERASK